MLHPRRHNCCLEDRVSKFHWNVSTYFYVPDYTVTYPKNATSFTLKVESTGLSKILVAFSQISTIISWKTIMLIFISPLHVVKDCDFGCWCGGERGSRCEIRNCTNFCFFCLQSDSDDVLSAGIHRQLAPLTRKTRPVTQLHGNIESDSFNENFSPVHPNTRRYCKMSLWMNCSLRLVHVSCLHYFANLFFEVILLTSREVNFVHWLQNWKFLHHLYYVLSSDKIPYHNPTV